MTATTPAAAPSGGGGAPPYKKIVYWGLGLLGFGLCVYTILPMLGDAFTGFVRNLFSARNEINWFQITIGTVTAFMIAIVYIAKKVFGK